MRLSPFQRCVFGAVDAIDAIASGQRVASTNVRLLLLNERRLAAGRRGYGVLGVDSTDAQTLEFAEGGRAHFTPLASGELFANAYVFPREITVFGCAESAQDLVREQFFARSEAEAIIRFCAMYPEAKVLHVADELGGSVPRQFERVMYQSWFRGVRA